MKIGILTFHRAYNCGAMLQAWALKTVLERMGHDVEFPICNHVGESRRWRLGWIGSDKAGFSAIRSLVGRTMINLLSVPHEDVLRYRYRRFRKNFLSERACAPDELLSYYDLVVVGSDQVWSARHAMGDAPLFLGESLPRALRKVAYAVSCGDTPPDAAFLERIAKGLENFDSVSARERLTQELISKVATQDIAEVLDPTLLLKAEDYGAVARGMVPRSPYLFMYTIPLNDFFVRTARQLAARLGVKCVIAPCYFYSRYRSPRGMTLGISPDRLVEYSRHAKYIVAGSFHGTALGALFNKPLLSLRGQIDECESRPASLLRQLGCGERLVNPSHSLDEMYARLMAPLPDFDSRLLPLRESSLAWLKGAINA